MTITQLVSDRLEETKTQLGTNVDWANAELRNIKLAKLEVYGSEVAESNIRDDRIKEFIALKVCLRMIELAVDYLGHASRLSDSEDGANYSYHDLVAELERKYDRFKRQIAEMASTVLDLVDTSEVYDDVIDISTLHTDRIQASKMLTPSPWAREPK